ncbi:right-handed parallel beta-helix repeat-containing protein [Cesiribacter sp. SM1]|uniref:right-handed parallel beta-helix repeat-containing protein n=1 Tax=Cesiribacter sp. SM1 TaxID=2861196 RepID=UPI001CD32507|nr:right-handed parallel beta-helix repeat-containing protein [Cesiribacter sp. SM1]
MKLHPAIASLLLVLAPFVLEGATYYVSPSGNDQHTGTSPGQAWASVANISTNAFQAGDSILFEGGQVFAGSLFFGPATAGTPTEPLVISSYGNGWATIFSGEAAGLKAYNTAGFHISRLKFEGSGRTRNSSTGIDFYLDLPGISMSYIHIDSVEVSGYQRTGILIGSWNGSSGFEGVRITNAVVHDNGEAGIATYAEAVLAHRNFYVAHCRVYNNSGLPERTDHHSGSGIMLGGIDGATVEYCEAYNNGWLNAWKGGGPVGIWGYHCNNLVIQYNESHHNRSGTAKDGGGFDLDGGCTNCTMQYNYAHDNEGPGYLIAQYPNAPVMKGLVVRYNISENDARVGNYGAIHLWSTGANGGIQDAQIYNNTVYLTPSGRGNPRAVFVQSGGVRNVSFRNNIFQISANLELVYVDVLTDLRFEGNNYWASGGSFKVRWGKTLHNSLDKWRELTTQEKVGGMARGYFLDPALIAAGNGGTLSDPVKLHTLQAYQLREASPLIGKGLDLALQFGTDAGKTDFWRNNIVARKDLSIGAHQPTPQSKVCLAGGSILLEFGPEPGGTYSGAGVLANGSFDPALAGPGHHALRYTYTSRSNELLTVDHTVQVLQASSTEWLGEGALNNDWFDSRNWSSCVPTALIDAMIPAPPKKLTPPMQLILPRIRKGKLARTKSLINNSSSVVEIEGTATLEIGGEYRGREVETTEDATVIFRSNQPQLIPAGNYGKLVLKGKGRKVLGADVRVSRELQMGQSSLHLKDHSLTIGSRAFITDASTRSYIITDGKGCLVYEEVGGERQGVFPVGSAESYLPATIENRGVPDAYSLHIARGVLREGATGDSLTEGIVNYTWHVDEALAGGSDVKLWLHWQAANELSMFDRSDSYISHYEGGNWSEPGLSASLPEPAAEEGFYKASLEHINSFSPFAVFNRNFVLPVTLSYFSAGQVAETVVLNWSTAAEKNSKGFWVEASEDGSTFHSLGFVASKTANSSQTQHYSFNDNRPAKRSTRYYRLQQEDVDGSTSYSDVKAVNFISSLGAASAYPNPFRNSITVRVRAGANDHLQLTLCNAMGNVVYRKTFATQEGENRQQFTLAGHYPPGLYILTIRTSQGAEQIRMIKR